MPGSRKLCGPSSGRSERRTQPKGVTVPVVTRRELLEAGLHFGHQTRRWNPRMQRYIWGERNGIHIIDLLQTEKLLHEARESAAGVAAQGGTILFVVTKKQARDSMRNRPARPGTP